MLTAMLKLRKNQRCQPPASLKKSLKKLNAAPVLYVSIRLNEGKIATG